MATPLTFREVLSVLSKASPYAVSTLRKGDPIDELLALKNYLYIELPIERDFQAALAAMQRGEIVFICGSAGDGKSEILTRCYKKYSDEIKFHLDATHSSGQHTSAVECLNQVFDKHKRDNTKLAIGINIGMMQKFLKTGAERHTDIKASLQTFFDNRHQRGFVTDKYKFFDFETYPRLTFEQGKVASDFVSDFLIRLTAKDEANPFYQAYLNDKKTDDTVFVNYELLSEVSVQDTLIELFAKARLYEEQFLIPRTFLDFIYQILASDPKRKLQDNIFSDLDNELGKKIALFDPTKQRHKALDDFILEYATAGLDAQSNVLVSTLSRQFGECNSAQSIIRLCYLLKNSDQYQELLGRFNTAFIDEAEQIYLELYHFQNKDLLSDEELDRYEDIFDNIIVKSLFLYANRNTPDFGCDYIATRVNNGFSVGAKIRFALDENEIKANKNITADYIEVPMIVSERTLPKIELDIKMLRLMLKIATGFRPNLQEKSVLIKFEEILSHVMGVACTVPDVKVSGPGLTKVVSLSGRKYVLGGD